MVSFGDGAKKIWGTEVGAPTRGPDSVSETDQALWLREYYDIWNGWAFTGPLFWYTARDTGNANTLEDSYGLVHHNRTPKPALAAFKAMVASSAVAPTTTIPAQLSAGVTRPAGTGPARRRPHPRAGSRSRAGPARHRPRDADERARERRRRQG